ncbi:MAG: potassium transporter [Polyangiaceae bacterium UTPRO1]|jgi:CPA2 family monovalent cation:H+ antiporter-2|nr:cation:proton antiporter [Myxococcales bacterium]OQY68944.1 MAG: potassium transporter [Polyangiaceae bacterium UTPRO1]
MHEAHEFLRSLTVVLAVAAITTVVFQRLRQPVVLGYIVAGLIVGPHVPLPLVADRATVQALSELGVILLMFSLGLEFSLGKLARVAPTAGFTAVLQAGLMAWLGFLVGRAFAWTVLESIFIGAAIAISSTTIVAKVFDERNIGGRQRELVVGILLIQDLIAIIFMAALTALATGAGLSAAALAATVGRLAAFLIVLLVVGMVTIPRFVLLVVGLERDETTLVASIGICFLTAWVAHACGYSVALGAFFAGTLVAESGHAEAIERLVRPVRDVFAAVFFVSVGILIDPALVIQNWGAVGVLAAVVIGGTITAVTVGAFLTGSGTRTAIQAGMSLAQIGEFSFIISGLGLTLGATREFVYPVTVAVSVITTLTTPWLVAAAEPVADWVDRKLPAPLQTFTTFYGTWVERMRDASTRRPTSQLRGLVRLIAIDATLLYGLIVAAALWVDDGAAFLARWLGLDAAPAILIETAIAIAAASPFVIGIGRLARRLAGSLAESALPRGASPVDLDAAPRRALIVTLQLGILLGIAVIVVAVTQPFLPSYPGPLLLLTLLAAFGLALWHSATNLQGHVRAGSQAIVEALTSYARRTGDGAGDGNGNAAAASFPLTDIHAMLTGLGEPIAVRLEAASPAVGLTLADLNLRGRTGASVLVILRSGQSVVPTATEHLVAGDVLAVAGTRAAIESAITMLRGDATPRNSP